MAVTPTISAHDDIPDTIVLHGLPFFGHIQQTLPNAPPSITSTSTLSSPDVAALLAVSWAQALGTGFPSRKPRFNSSNANVGNIVYKVAPGKVFLRVLRFSPVSITPPMLHSHLHPSPTLHNL